MMQRPGSQGGFRILIFAAIVALFVAQSFGAPGAKPPPGHPGGGKPPIGNPGDPGDPPGGPVVDHQARQNPPISLGTSGGWFGDLSRGYCCGGTLGGLVYGGGTYYILSNYHVFAGDRVAGGNGIAAQPGDAIIQPGLIDVNCDVNAAQVVGYLAGWADPLAGANIDAAIAEVAPGMVDLNGDILGIGRPAAGTVAAYVGQRVKKSGRTTGLTSSQVSALNATIQVDYETECAGQVVGTATFTGQIIVSNPGEGFLTGGDSGSMLLEDEAVSPRAVGLLYAGSSSTAIANPIDEVLGALGVTMIGDSLTGAAVSARASSPATQATRVNLAKAAQLRYKSWLEDVPEGIGHGIGVRGTDEIVIKVFVEKNPDEARRRLPGYVGGIPVVVEEIGRIVAF